jgi:hypothetical protein
MKVSMNLQPLKQLAKKSPKKFQAAMAKGGIQFLTWANTGSGGTSESRKPPIRFGILRGSSSVFIGSTLVKVFPQTIKSGSGERPTPATGHSAPELTLTFVWNTDYAAKMHETEYSPGPYSEQDGDAGNKWIEKHIQADKNLLMQFIAKEFKL